nr:structural maintenance of chromosomes 1 [Cryptomonas sp.]
MTKNTPDVQFLKVENFKSYRKPSIFDTIQLNGCIIGRNGVGKTNFSDALVFVLGGNMDEFNCSSLQSLFPDFFLNKSLVTSKVSMLISNDKISVEFIRTIDIKGVCCYFLNGDTVSFFHYKRMLKRFNFENYRDLMILKDLPNNPVFSRNKSLTQIAYRIANSDETSNIRIRINLLKNKLKENYSFYFQKMKFLVNERNILVYQIDNLNNLKKIEVNTKHQNAFYFFSKKFFWFHDVWKLNKKTTKVSYQKMELKKQRYLAFCSFSKYFKNIEKATIEKNLVGYIVSNFRFLNKKLIKDYIVSCNVLSKCLDVYISHCLKYIYRVLVNKKDFIANHGIIMLLGNFRHFIFSLNINLCTRFKKILTNFGINMGSILNYSLFFDKYEQIFKKVISNFCEIQRDGYYSMYFHLFQITNVLEINTLQIKIKYEKTLQISFYYTIYFIVVLIFSKENAKLEKNSGKIDCQNYSIELIKKLHLGIRGKIGEIFKILDSRYRLVVQNFTKETQDIIAVDNIKVAFDCMEFIKKKKLVGINFLSRREINNNREKLENEDLKRTNISLKYFEFDTYDLDLLVFMIQKKLRLDNSLLNKNSIHGGKNKKYSIGNEIIIENLSFQTISFFPSKFEKKYTKNIKKNYKKKKNLIMEVLNRKIVSTVNERNLFNKLSKKKNQNYKPYFKVFESLIMSITILYSSNVSISYKLLESQVISRIVFEFEFSLLIISFFKIKRHGNLKHFMKNEYLAYENLVLCSIFQVRSFTFKFIQRNIYERNINFASFEKINMSSYISKILMLNRISFYIDRHNLGTFYIETEKKLTKKLDYIPKTYNLRKLTCMFFHRMYNHIMQKKKKIFHYKKEIRFLIVKSKKQFYFFNNCLQFYKNFFESDMLQENIILNEYGNKFDLSLFLNKQIILEVHNIRITKNIFLSKTSSNKYQFLNKKMLSLQSRLKFIQRRFIFLKKQLLKNKYQQLIVENKLSQITKESSKKFNLFFQLISENINYIYKEITKTILNPLGGTAFLSYIKDKNLETEKIIYVAIPSSRKTYDTKDLSGGEKTVASFALIMALNVAILSPLILCDEIDNNLDHWHSEKIMIYMKSISDEKKIKFYIITLKLRFVIIFRCIVFVFISLKGSDFYNFIF